MNYTSNDFFQELAFNSLLNDGEQMLERQMDDYVLVDDDVVCDDPVQSIMTGLNDYNRIEKDTHFKVHKGYPSPRSLYPIRLFVVTKNGSFLTKNDQTKKFELYENAAREGEEGDILLEYGKVYPAYYKSIKKSLLLLEAGHLIYNIHHVAKSCEARYQVVEKNGYLLLKKAKSPNQDIQQAKLEKFYHLSSIRNSGPYLHPITAYHLIPLLDNALDFQKLTEQLISLFMQPLKKNAIRLIKLQNDGDGLFHIPHKEPKVDYKKLNSIYPYINFKGVSGMYVFTLDNLVFSEEENITPYILAIGFLAQFYCMLYASEQNYCRPVKSYNIGDFEHLLGINGSHTTIMYSLIIGGK
ncbi:hypothetical protein M3936_09970 [Sutcliffiella horikoshii]|uniref:hypothetical protein n=1 Tax=Sutcliffiella horikoshii TaxID=79883 RepID=UPI00203B0304|nr:hypothetical protein [Sutcliffiella horikoshii]MCM3617906.1 hypothetical protein [Sutcliffiella horikoshii]